MHRLSFKLRHYFDKTINDKMIKRSDFYLNIILIIALT